LPSNEVIRFSFLPIVVEGVQTVVRLATLKCQILIGFNIFTLNEQNVNLSNFGQVWPCLLQFLILRENEYELNLPFDQSKFAL